MAFVRAKKRGPHTYYYLVEGKRVKGKVQQKVLRYLGTEETLMQHGPASGPSAPIQVVRAVRHGSVAALRSIADRIGIADSVRAEVPKGGGPDIGHLIEMMAINRAIDPVSTHQLPTWISRSSLPNQYQLDSDSLSADVFYNMLGYFDDETIVRIEKRIWKRLKVLDAKSDRVFYDLTSSYFEGGCCELAEFGHSREYRPDRKQVNIAVATNEQGFPISHMVMPGNIHDSKTLDDALDLLRGRFDSRGIIVLDRGFFGDPCRNQLEARNAKYIMGQKMDSELARWAASKAISKFKQASKADQRYFVCDEIRDGRRTIIVLNKDKKVDDAAWREMQLDTAEARLSKLAAKGKKTRSALISAAESILADQKVKELIVVTVNPRGRPRLSWKRNRHKINWAIRKDGRWVLETNTKLSPMAVFWAYHQRGIVEQFFRTMKDRVELRPHFVRKENHVKARVFACVISVLLLQYYHMALRRESMGISGVAALEELDGITEVLVRQGDEEQWVVSQMSDFQRQLLDLAKVV